MTSIATGDYVCRLAADDYALQGYVKTLLGLAEQYPQARIVSGALLYTRGSLEFNWCLNRRAIRFPITKYAGMGNLKAGYHSHATYLHFLGTEGFGALCLRRPCIGAICFASWAAGLTG